MSEFRQTVTYSVSQLNAKDEAIAIAIDIPFNGFFGETIVVPVATGSPEEQAATRLKWVTDRVRRHVGEAVDHLTFTAL